MRLLKRKMTHDFAVETLHWKYEKPYDLYNNELNAEAIEEILGCPYFAVVDQDDELIGYFCTGISAQVPAGNKVNAYTEDMVDIGIGMKPNLTGKGFGTTFFSFILHDIEQTHPNIQMRLTVATFNKRAIRLYEKCGFIKKKRFESDITEFITMVKEK